MMTTTQLNKQQPNPITMTMKKILLLILMSFMTLLTANAQNDIVLSCPDDNHPHAIDLGLPSGTKWACCNVGAIKPEEYGGYYAFGETMEKDWYDWSTYIHCDGRENTCHYIGDDIAGTQYDVAHVKWGGSWVMPSMPQLEELIENCTYTWTTMNGVEGGKFTGPSGSTIFLPAAGYHWNDNLYTAGSDCDYWSSSQYPSYSYCAYGLFFRSGYAYWNGYYNRLYGLTVRPVISGTTNINLPKSSSKISSQAIYNLYGIKVSDSTTDLNTLPPGIYIVNGKKRIVK